MGFRKITNAGRRICIGKFPSLKMGRNVWFESLLERDLIFMLEYDSDVISYREQAIRIFYELNGKRRYYTADILCQRKNQKPQVIEVKYQSELSKPKIDQVIRTITPICEREGYDFLVYTEIDIRVQPLLDNIKLLRIYARTPLIPYHKLLCYEMFVKTPELSLQEVFHSFAAKGIGKEVVLALLYRGVISTDFTGPIEPNSLIRCNLLLNSKEA
ncbi:MAG: hypothetical protein QOE77_2325 [Blastocatellia bacterium]|jgi:hypothetical protein|nr:hypothetical protein [Blastocatellia bacterium]